MSYEHGFPFRLGDRGACAARSGVAHELREVLLVRAYKNPPGNAERGCRLGEQQHRAAEAAALRVQYSHFDFRGISGGPMLAVVETDKLRSWVLAGVIYEGPNPSDDPEQAIAGLEIIKARRAHFILPDGRLDIPRWEALG